MNIILNFKIKATIHKQICLRVQIKYALHQNKIRIATLQDTWHYDTRSKDAIWFKDEPISTEVRRPLNGQCANPGFSLGGLGVAPSGENFANPPIRHLSPYLYKGLFPPDEVGPQKFENLNTFLCQIWLLLSSKVP